MISLIINADDLGSGHARDRGIFDAFKHGIVTSASLLANGPTFTSAAELSARLRLPVGVHLNLADGFALTGPIAGLTDTDGRLPGKGRLRQCLAAGACDQAALQRELAAQITRVLAAGLTPDHLNSHQHCQLFPCLSSMFVELALQHGIRALRQALPAEPQEHDPDGRLGGELALYRQLAISQPEPDQAARSLFRPDGLWGMPLLDRLDTASLCRTLEEIPDGCWELMTHPGYPAQHGDEFSGPSREIELQALCSPEALSVIRRRGIRLCTFGDLSCTS